MAADTQFVVKLSGDCQGKWLDIRFAFAGVRCTSNRKRFVETVVHLLISHMLAKGHGHAGAYSNNVHTLTRDVVV